MFSIGYSSWQHGGALYDLAEFSSWIKAVLQSGGASFEYSLPSLKTAVTSVLEEEIVTVTKNYFHVEYCIQL